jgi:hypothetical protein
VGAVVIGEGETAMAEVFFFFIFEIPLSSFFFVVFVVVVVFSVPQW